jgi:DNA processing protein
MSERSRQPPGDGALPPAAWVAALSGLPALGPARLAALLARWSPEEAWVEVVAGRAHLDPGVAVRARTPELVASRWRTAALEVDVAAAWEAHGSAGVTVRTPGEDGFPAVLAADPEPPAVLFCRGDVTALQRPRVAVVGTRRCTWAGRSVAAELGAGLATAGVCVVSGLALGIDAAAHRGALAAQGAPPVAVVGTGLDVVYPRRNGELWAAVGAAGAVLSEYPLGTRPEPWRFPARNRLVAGLADIVVVVESHARGGSLHTVTAALERGVEVMAVPGPVRGAASAGTNALLVAGAAPVRDAGDVLVALGLDSAAAGRRTPEPDPGLDTDEAGVLAALQQAPATVAQLADRLDRSVGPVAVVLAHLETRGLVVSSDGWWEAAAPMPGPWPPGTGSVP